MHNVQLIDTPRRTALAAHSTALRTKLKQWEKSFADSHSGQKPGKDDIKACVEIAKTYKEYYRVRDVLAGKLNVKSLDDSKRATPTAREGSRNKHEPAGHTSETEPTGQAVNASTPCKASAGSRQCRTALLPNLLDPYQPPTSVSPRPSSVTAIGPTPQRDGKVLGLFDLLSNSGNSSQATPSTRKRKVDALSYTAQADVDAGKWGGVAQTPSRKRMRKEHGAGDLLDYLDDDTPKGYQKHSRTPESEGRKFMLSQFFATPTTMRFASIVEDQERVHHSHAVDQDVSGHQTRLRTFVLGDRANGLRETRLTVLDATPAYLKRSCSFKDRLLSASTSPTRTNKQKPNIPSSSSFPVGPATLRKYKSDPSNSAKSCEVYAR
jgi:hypothetical protein